MSLWTLPNISAFAGAIAASLWISVPGALGGSAAPVESQARYAPIQNISYAFGSKAMSGYFVERGSKCHVTLMIIEKSDPEVSLPPSPARVRLVLYPGQIAGLDSEEGRSLNFTCGDDATTLLVDAGARERLVKLQTAAGTMAFGASP